MEVTEVKCTKCERRRQRRFNRITFTESQVEVMSLVCQGLQNKTIADRRFVAVKTIKFHLTDIFALTGVSNRWELIHWCARHPDYKTPGFIIPRVNVD